VLHDSPPDTAVSRLTHLQVVPIPSFGQFIGDDGVFQAKQPMNEAA
jgi:hypothetical protein